MTPAKRVITAAILPVVELVTLAASILLGFIGVFNAMEVSIAGYRPTPSERRLGAVLVAIAILLPAVVPFCVWLKTRSRAALIASGVPVAVGALVWLFLVAT